MCLWTQREIDEIGVPQEREMMKNVCSDTSENKER